jgi:hypothetical protein
MILSPCRKCIVRAMCSQECEPYLKRQILITKILFRLHRTKYWGVSLLEVLWENSFGFIIDLWKEREWGLFTIIFICYIGIVAQVINFVLLIVRVGEL